MTRFAFFLALIVSMGLAAACGSSGGSDDEPDDGSDTGTSALLTHDGFDFSMGTSGAPAGYDGETVGWQPDGGTHTSYPNNSTWIWWRNSSALGTAVNLTKDMGAVSLDSVKSVPTAWDVAPNIPPLMAGHVIVASCGDGYVKFRIESVTDGNIDWHAQVKYVWSATNTFP